MGKEDYNDSDEDRNKGMPILLWKRLQSIIIRWFRNLLLLSGIRKRKGVGEKTL
jgi:hypothetical protein